MFNFRSKHKTAMPDPENALPGRETPMPVPDQHYVLGTPLRGPFPQDTETAIFGAGCFWGVEKSFWNAQPGVFTTAVGYAAGMTPNPTYKEVCGARTGHNEVVLVAYRPSEISFEDLLKRFWEGHDPTQGMRQGNDVGTQYRSGIYTTTDAQLAAAQASRDRYREALTAAGRGEITTEIMAAPEFFYAEDYHQQYLAKNPAGYCGAGGTGVSCPIGTGVPAKPRG